MTKSEWWSKKADEQKRELRDKPDVARAMYENADWPEFEAAIYELREVLSDVGRVRVRSA